MQQGRFNVPWKEAATLGTEEPENNRETQGGGKKRHTWAKVKGVDFLGGREGGGAAKAEPGSGVEEQSKERQGTGGFLVGFRTTRIGNATPTPKSVRLYR